MISLFRKIRYDLMGKNKPAKYLKYAVGEIILVVIGILIALQINNWNEGQIRQNDSNTSLVQIFNDLQEDREFLELYIKLETEHVSTLTAIIKGNNSQGLDSILQSLDHYMHFAENNNGYSSLKNLGGISNISNSELKSSLTTYYEKTYGNLSMTSNFTEKFTNDRVIPFLIANLRPDIDMLTTNDLVLKKLETSNLRYLINYQINVKKYSIIQVRKGLKNIFELILLIEKELGLKNSKSTTR